MDDKKKKNEESVSRRSFLTSLGKWSSIVVATAVLGISEASGSDERPKEERGPGAAREGIPGHDDAHEESMESQWWAGVGVVAVCGATVAAVYGVIVVAVCGVTWLPCVG